MRFEIIDVTPTLAGQLLNANTGNRRLRKDHVHDLAQRMRRGEWRLSPEAISFDVNGRLIDGQHRLNAIVDSGVTCRMLVVFDAPAESFAVIDQGIRRSIADVLTFDKRVVEPCNYAAFLLHSGRPSYEVVKPILESEIGVAILNVVSHCPSTRRVASSAPVRLAAAIWMCARPSSERYVLDTYRSLVMADFAALVPIAISFFKQIDSGMVNSHRQSDAFARAISVFDETKRNNAKLLMTDNLQDSALRFARSVIIRSLGAAQKTWRLDADPR